MTAALEAFVARLPDDGSFSVWAGRVLGPPVVAFCGGVQHYAASTMKLALVMAAFRECEQNRLDLDSTVLVHNEFRSAADGSRFAMDADDDSDPEPWRRLGAAVTLRWLCYRSLVRSSNLATNLLLEATGFAPVSDVLATVGATKSCVTRGIEDAAARAAGLQNVVTASDLAATLRALATLTIAGAGSCREVLSVLAASQLNEAIPAGLPPATWVAHKSGWVDGVTHDAGLIRPPDAPPFVFVMCTTSDLSERDALELIAAGAAATWTDRRVLG